MLQGTSETHDTHTRNLAGQTQLLTAAAADDEHQNTDGPVRLRDNLAARSEAGRRLRTCQRRAGRIGTKISNCKSVVMVFTVSVGFAMDGILGVSESRKRCVCNGRRPIPNFFAQDDEVLHSQKAR